MPDGTAGALVHCVCAHPGGTLDVLWLPAGAPRLPLGRILLRWEPAATQGWTVHAHLSLATTDVLLARWPTAPDHWPDLVRPTLYEVTGLCHALTLATTALHVANHLAET